MAHEISEGFVRKVGKNYFMRLVVDGQKQQKATGTDDLEKAMEMLAEWRAEIKVGVQNETRLRYEDIRDHYVNGGKPIQPSGLQDLNAFFKNLRISAFTVKKIAAFREFRESKAEVLEYKEETFQKEFALRKLKAANGRKSPLSADAIAKIEAEARIWVENGVKATTNRRLTTLRAMFRFAAKKELIKPSDIPASFELASGVDNIRTNKFTSEQFESILKELKNSSSLPLIRFLHATGMRSGQAKSMTWDMIDENNHLVIPGEYTKNKKPFSMPLVDKKGHTYDFTKAIVNQKNRPHGEHIFDTTNLRSEWRRACHKLGFGIFDEKTQAYRGAQLHDFRRTAVSNMNAKGISKATAMAVSGHKTSSMFERYGIEDVRQVQDAFESLSGK